MNIPLAPIDAEEIGRRVLRMIGNLRNAQDLSPERIEQETGIRVEFNDEDRNIYGFGGKLTDDWSYSLVSTPEKQGEKPTRLQFSFDRTSAGEADPTPICKLRFEDYSQALVASGFAVRPTGGFRGSDGWYFTRGDIGVLAYTDKKPDSQPERVCLSKLIISAYA